MAARNGNLPSNHLSMGACHTRHRPVIDRSIVQVFKHDCSFSVYELLCRVDAMLLLLP